MDTGRSPAAWHHWCLSYNALAHMHGHAAVGVGIALASAAEQPSTGTVSAASHGPQAHGAEALRRAGYRCPPVLPAQGVGLALHFAIDANWRHLSL